MSLTTYGTRSNGSEEPAVACFRIFGHLRFDCFNVVEIFEVQQIIAVLRIVIIRVYWSKGVIQFYFDFLLLERIVVLIIRFIRVS